MKRGGKEGEGIGRVAPHFVRARSRHLINLGRSGSNLSRPFVFVPPTPRVLSVESVESWTDSLSLPTSLLGRMLY